MIASTTIAPPADPYPHPDLPPPSAWPGVMVIVILLGFIATAAVLGPIVRALMREEPTTKDERDE